jgi:hypothetical protein
VPIPGKFGSLHRMRDQCTMNEFTTFGCIVHPLASIRFWWSDFGKHDGFIICFSCTSHSFSTQNTMFCLKRLPYLPVYPRRCSLYKLFQVTAQLNKARPRRTPCIQRLRITLCTDTSSLDPIIQRPTETGLVQRLDWYKDYRDWTGIETGMV